MGTQFLVSRFVLYILVMRLSHIAMLDCKEDALYARYIRCAFGIDQTFLDNIMQKYLCSRANS
jgi:hypothetical protein